MKFLANYLSCLHDIVSENGRKSAENSTKMQKGVGEPTPFCVSYTLSFTIEKYNV